MRKNFLPSKLLARMLLIIIVPTMLAQVISTCIFYSKHRDNISTYIIYTLSNEIALITNTFTSLPRAKVVKINKYTFLRYAFLPHRKIIKMNQVDELPEAIKILKTNIEYNLPEKIVNVEFNHKTKEVKVNIGNIAGGILSFYTNPKKVFVKTTYTFIVWMIGSSLILLAITIIFAKNQIKSITRLGRVAERLAEGKNVSGFIPQGAAEIRKAGYAFLKMKETIEEEVKRKSEMLAWVSHDLRTPLTRMKLQLAIGNSNSQLIALREDIIQMEKVVNDYLEFTRGQVTFKVDCINLSNLFKDVTRIVKIGSRVDFDVCIQEGIFVKVNENYIKRALFNLIDNAKRFGSRVKLKLYRDLNKSCIIEIHDNGPGSSEKEIKDVFKPFYRGDNYRNQEENGVGLGIPIACNIVKKHGGNIRFASSSIGGLLVVIHLDGETQQALEK